MYANRRVALVVPAHNEERLIGQTLRAIPDTIDRIYVVDDCSTDNQNKVVERCAEQDKRIVLLRHERNTGPGGAIITGYLRSSQDKNDITVVIGGDAQMDLSELSHFLDPIIEGRADYTKGNRFLIGNIEQTIQRMPKLRFFANWLITAMTKVASGYFKVMDVVDGFTAISRRAIDTIDWSCAWKGYGYPMDFLVRLNAYGFQVVDVPRTAIYLKGERQSQIKALRYATKVFPMIVRAFLWRLRFKYVYLDFHPLVLFYFFSFFLLPSGVLLGLYLVFDKLFLGGLAVTPAKSVLVTLLLLTGFQFLLFAMLFDREESRTLSSAKEMEREISPPVEYPYRHKREVGERF